MRLIASFLLMTLLTGCQYDRSFLNMNSDSGIPFLGLQMAVDASDSRKDSAREPIKLVSNEPSESVLTLKAKTTRAQSPKWTSVSVPAALSTPGAFPNPMSTIEVDEHPLTAVGRRLAAF